MCTHTSEVHTRELSSFSFHKHATKEILTHSKVSLYILFFFFFKLVHSSYINTSIHMVLNLFQVKLLKKEKCQEPYTVHTSKPHINLLKNNLRKYDPFDFPCLNNLVRFPFNQNNFIILLSCLPTGLPTRYH